MWSHSPGNGRLTEYHERAPAAGLLFQHRSRLPPVGCTTGTGIGSHRDPTGKLNDPVTYLNGEGANHYFEYPAYALGRAIFDLDRTVWHLRRYCYLMRGQHDLGSGQVREKLPYEIERVHSISEQ
jgi:hypothetical protein